MSRASSSNIVVAPSTDKRADGWFLMDDFLEVLAIVVAYLLFVGFAPRFMEKRKPFDLKWLIIPYNFFMVAVSGYITVEVQFPDLEVLMSWIFVFMLFLFCNFCRFRTLLGRQITTCCVNRATIHKIPSHSE